MKASASTLRHCFVWLPLLALILAACGTPGVVGHPTPTTAPTRAASPSPGALSSSDAYLSHLAQTGAFRGSALIARDGVVLLSKGYGPADEASHIPNTAHTRFRIGSITKQFTAMAILILQERGKLQVQDHLCLYISDCPQDWQPITLQHLLTHTSGIPDYINSPEFSPLIGMPATPEQLIARFKNKPLLFPPGARWSYSNSGYALLGYIIEQLSGESYARFLAENIFGPLHMTNSGYDDNHPQLPEHATGYLRAGVEPVYFDMSEAYAAGALYSTVEDLYRWDQALATHRLVSQDSLDTMFTVYIPCPSGGCALASDRGYGYGWFIATQFNHTLIYHLGHIDGFLTFNGFYPQDNVDIVVLSNLDSGPVLGISTDLGAMTLGTS